MQQSVPANSAPERFLHLPSGHNFRDLGGYPTADGRMVRWQQIYRSGHMSSISEADSTRLHALGIDTICDLRANEERSRRPTLWHQASSIDLWSRDYDFSSGAFFELFDRSSFDAPKMHATMLNVYRELPFEQADSYREMFIRIATGRVPLIFNCSAGKDRTGVAAALLLTLLGVPRDVIEADYLLTNEFLDSLVIFMADDPRYKTIVNRQRDQVMPLMLAELAYLRTAFTVIEDRHQTVSEYLKNVLGLSERDQGSIRENLLV
jgi:protein-tyrosine phosphatase